MARIATLDLETGGLDPEANPILEIGICFSDSSLRELGFFEAKIAPREGMEIVPEAIKINGYKPELWASALSEDAILPLVRDALDGYEIYTWGSNLDWAFLSAGYRRVGLPAGLPDNKFQFWDLRSMAEPLAQAGVISSSSEHIRLSDARRYFGITDGMAHSAIADARAALSVLRELRALYSQVLRYAPRHSAR